MKKSIAALIHHCSENDEDEDRHQYLLSTNESWCQYQLDKIQKTSKYKKLINIPKGVSELIKLIFSWKDLGADNILNRCLDGETQNANESLNNAMWRSSLENCFCWEKLSLQLL